MLTPTPMMDGPAIILSVRSSSLSLFEIEDYSRRGYLIRGGCYGFLASEAEKRREVKAR